MQDHRAAGRAPPPPPLLLLLQLLLLSRAAALHPDELFPYGEAHGDQRLREGDDQSSAAVQLAVPLRFYDAQFRSLYVGTNGIISTQDFPKETQYVDDDLPTDFPAIVPFLADIDTSGGRGRVLYRQDSSPAVLGLAARYVRAGFPHAAASFTPTHAFVATWDQVGAYEEVGRGAAPSEELNTFQAVLASDESDAYALFLYPANGLQFFGTRPKESYNVQLQLPARVGFCRGEADDLKREGKYLSLTRTEQSVKNLYQLSNVGIPGLWAFHIGSTSSLDNVRPAAVGGALSAAHSSAPLKHPFSHAAALKADHPEDSLDYYDENEEEVEYPPAEAEAATVDIAFHSSADSGPEAGGLSPPDSDLASPLPPPASSEQPSHPHSESTAGEPPSKQEARLQEVPSPEWRPRAQPLGQTGAGSVVVPAVDGDSVAPAQEAPTRHPDDAGARYSVPSLSGGGRSVAGVEEDITPNAKVFTYNAAPKETCERNHGQCSAHAFCTDYTAGFCCHCQSSFFGDGKHCLPEGAPHRVNGKVSGHLRVGHTPVHFTDVDLHAYIVGNDGRAYTAISHIPPPAAQALLPLTPLGGLFGWLFALEKPGSENGFSLTGATFVQDTEVTFYPGEERLRIIQTAEGLDPENYLSMKINIQGQVPYVPANSIAHLAPYKEIYHHSDSGVTSTSSRDYYLTFGTVNQTGSYRIHQNITYQGCRHAPSHRAVPAAQQLTVDRVFALYNEEEGVLRFAVTSQIGPVEVTAPPPNPCEDGTHTCAPAEQARCIPHGDGTFSCACLPGYAGDGHQCSDVDECSEKSCHPAATCHNTPGSFSCRCQPGYLGDGFKCTPDSGSGRKACQQQQLYVQAQHAHPRTRLHVPQCDEQGNFLPLQCHGSTGFCWCVNSDGHEVPGTQTPPGSTPPHCGPPPGPTKRPRTMCERWKESLLEHYGGTARDDQYVPQCDDLGRFVPLQCHGKSDFCWCVDKDGREVVGTRTQPGVTPTCLPEAVPPPIGAMPRPEEPPPLEGSFLVYAQKERLGQLPLKGTQLLKKQDKTLRSMRGSIIVGLDYDCRERKLYWTDAYQRVIGRIGAQPGAEPEVIISSGLLRPEGLAVDFIHRTMYWTDSGLNQIVRSNLDGSEKTVLFYVDLVNPRAITVDPVGGNLYWTDWNRDYPKIETSSLAGTGRRILIGNDLGLPNGLNFDPVTERLCWVDAGTRKLECTLRDGTGRQVIHSNLNHPFSVISYIDHFYYTDWRKDAIISVDAYAGEVTDVHLPKQRDHLYGITAVFPYCP